ncbi:MAG: hypothetical protein ABIN89_27075, partial [Chitinophagaceae bacterium]
MTKQKLFSRRKFIGTAAVTAGSCMLPAFNGFAYFNANSLYDYPSTDHFWYRKPSNSPYVDSQNKNMAFAFSDTEILFSDDN